MPARRRSGPRAGQTELSPVRGRPWRDSAACRDDPDPDAWFAEARDKTRLGHALAVCRVCPVRAQCLEFALARRQQYGVWGGLTEDERNRPRAASRRDQPA